MMDSIGKVTISEIILLFFLIFVLPLMALMLQRIRKYERVFGPVPEPGAMPPPADPVPQPPFAKREEKQTDGTEDGVYPYALRAPLSDAERLLFEMMRHAVGSNMDVYAKVAVREAVDSTDPAPGYSRRLEGMTYDFLLCDRGTGQPFTAVGADDDEELRKISEAAGIKYIVMDTDAEYDDASVKETLGLLDLDF